MSCTTSQPENQTLRSPVAGAPAPKPARGDYDPTVAEPGEHADAEPDATPPTTADRVAHGDALLMRTTGRSWIVWGAGLLAYIVAVFDRTSLGVVAEQATARFGIGASEFSLFVVTQLMVYALMQVPTGVLLDRFGPRIMIATGALVMASGQLAIAYATSLDQAIGARILVGAGDAMTFISVLRFIPAWFSPLQAPLLTQLTGQVGQLGQVLSAVPLVALLAAHGWTTAYAGAAALGVVAAILVLLISRDRPPGAPAYASKLTLRQINRNLRESFLDPGTRLGLWSHFTAGFSGIVFAMMWGFPFLTLGIGLSPVMAGSLITLMVFGAVVSGPIMGRLTASFPMRRSNLVLLQIALTIVMWTIVLAWPGPAPVWILVLLILTISMNGPTSMIGFDFARSFNPINRLGGATGIVNMGCFVAGLAVIFAVGLVLDLRGGEFELNDFKWAFATQYLVWAIGLAGVWRTRVLTRRIYGAPVDHLHQAAARRWQNRRGRG